MTASELSIHFFAQMAVILIAARLVGWFAHKYLMQPQVVGEMIAGVILGPSLFGLLAPQLQAWVFPAETKSVLYVVAQLAVGLYMFLVGLEFRVDHFRAQMKSAAAVSVAGMAAPFLFAVILTPWLLQQPNLFAPTLSQSEATLFMGAAIALTAFPMLARIIKERGMADTSLGTLSLSAGAFGDAVAWGVLAIVLASFGGGAKVAYLAIGGGLAFAAFMVLAGRQLFAPLEGMTEKAGGVTPNILAIAMIAFMFSAFAMDAVGIHAVFGGFLLGCVMPRGKFSTGVQRQLEPFTVAILLPVFFTYSGLHTRLDLVADPWLLFVALVIFLVSVAAKFGACWAAARLTGQDNATSLGIGALMNARGLMELIIINIGLQKGIIGETLFSMLVLMAVVTTVMASPLFELVYGRYARRKIIDEEELPIFPN